MTNVRASMLISTAIATLALGACGSSSTTKVRAEGAPTSSTAATTTSTPPTSTAATTTTELPNTSTSAAAVESALSKSVASHLSGLHALQGVTVSGDETSGITITYDSAKIDAATAGSLCTDAAMVAGPTAALTVHSTTGTKAASRVKGTACK